MARGQDYILDLDAGKATIGVVAKDQTRQTISLEFSGSRPSRAVPDAELPGKVNYIRGNDPRKWRIGVPTYSRVIYAGVIRESTSSTTGTSSSSSSISW